MKKTIKTLLALALVWSILEINLIQTYATDYQSTTCDFNINPFTVDQLSVSNGIVVYTSQGCYTNYWDANTKFEQLRSASSTNIVIRYFGNADSNFQSPLKIIKADRAMAYSQNDTYAVGNRTSTVINGVTYYSAATINIYNDVALSSIYTYIDSKEPLFYYTTEAINSNTTVIPSNMTAYVQINGAKGYITLDGIDIIPYIYSDDTIHPILAPFYIKDSLTSPKELYQKIGRDPGIYIAQPKYTIIGDEISLGVDRATGYDSVGVYTKKASFMTTGSIYYSPDGINFYTDYTLTNLSGTFYNYYNFLSLRTKTAISGTQLNTYLNAQNKPTSVMLNQGDTFINAQDTYGMNALLIYAMAIHESAYGTNVYSTTRYNLFSVNAVDSNPDEADYFASILDSVTAQMGTILRYYMDTNSTKFYGSNIGNKGAGFNTKYASDPYWATKIAKYAYLIDKNYSLIDYNKYSLALLKPEISSSLYTTRNLTTSLYSIPTRALNYPVTLTASYNSVYYAQSTSPIASGSLVTNATTGLISYDWINSMAYLNQNQVDLINTPTSALTVVTDTDQLLVYVTNWDWQDNNLYIKGWAALKNTNMSAATVTHQLKIINMDTDTFEVININVATEDYELSIGNTYDYSNAWFDGSIGVSSLSSGNYRFEIITKAGDTTGTLSLFNSTIDAPRTETRIIDNILYRSSFNNTRGMRFELSKENGLNITDISPILPTRFNSTAYLTNLAISTSQDSKELLNITGLAFMLGVSTGLNNSVTHSLILLDDTGNMYTFPLTSGTGVYDISNNGFDYSHAWFYGVDLDITNLPIGQYEIFILSSTSLYKDAVELRDILIQNNQEFISSANKYTLIMNSNVRRRYDFKKENLVIQ